MWSRENCSKGTRCARSVELGLPRDHWCSGIPRDRGSRAQPGRVTRERAKLLRAPTRSFIGSCARRAPKRRVLVRQDGAGLCGFCGAVVGVWATAAPTKNALAVRDVQTPDFMTAAGRRCARLRAKVSNRITTKCGVSIGVVYGHLGKTPGDHRVGMTFGGCSRNAVAAARRVWQD